MKLYLVRFDSSKFGTKGMLFHPSGWHCCTMEPPWIHNLPYVSCIPSGMYDVKMTNSPRYGNVYKVELVPKRTDILFHIGNYAGHEESGLRSDTDGCILPGEHHGWLGDQEVVLNSSNTFREFMALMGGEDFRLVVKGVNYEIF